MKEFTAGASLGQQYLFLEKPDATARHRHISIKSPTHVDVDYKRHRYQIGEKCFLLFTVCLFRPLRDWWQAFCRQMLCVCFQIKLHENSREQVTVSCGGSLLAILFRVKSNHSAHFILSPHITQSCRCQSPQKTDCTHKVWFNQLPHAYMTEVGLGRIQALGPKWVAGYGPWRKCALLWWREKKRKGLVIRLLPHVQDNRIVPVARLTSWQTCSPLGRDFHWLTCRARGLQVLTLAR